MMQYTAGLESLSMYVYILYHRIVVQWMNYHLVTWIYIIVQLVEDHFFNMSKLKLKSPG